MSTMGKGAPLDELDAVCKAYKECQKCARQRFGEMCIGEFVRYGMDMVNGYPVCNDNGDTCGRALCECDRNLVAVLNSGSPDSSLLDFNASKCKHGSTQVTLSCCNYDSHHWRSYNIESQSCCVDGVRPIGTC